jgi:adenylate cyclase
MSDIAEEGLDRWPGPSSTTCSTPVGASGAPWPTVLVEALLQRGGDADLEDARAAIDCLAAVPTDPGFVLHEITLLRLQALLARAHGDDAAYAHFRDGYCDMTRTLGFEGHIAWAEAMP